VLIFLLFLKLIKPDISQIYQNREVDGRSLLELMTLEAPEGSKVQIRVEGADAAEAMREIDRLIQSVSEDEE
jgi:phosphotransferase system HPr (HPr) family protein